MADTLRFRAVFAGKTLVGEMHDLAQWRYGVHAKYRQLTPKWGMKFFVFETQRDENYAMQAKLARHNVAPRVKCKFSFKYRNMHFYGYLTEVAEVLQDMPYEERQEYLSPWGSQSHRRQQLRIKVRQALGQEMDDAHTGNLGVVRGHLMLIDYSTMTDERYDRCIIHAQHR